MADDRDLHELLTSPLDQPDSFRMWWPFIAGVAIAVVGVVLGYLLASGGSDTAQQTSTSTSTSTTAAAGAPDQAAFPPGYTEVSDLIAIKPQAAIVFGGRIEIGFDSAVRRGFDPEQSTPFTGGRWVLETSAGDRIESIGSGTSFTGAGAFSVIFPWDGQSAPVLAGMELVEGLSSLFTDGHVDVPVGGFPAEATNVVFTELPAGEVRIDRVTVDEAAARVEWSAPNDTEVQPSFFITLADGSGRTVGVWYEQQAGFVPSLFGGQPAPTESSGTVTLLRDTGQQSSDETPATMTIDGTLYYSVAFPASGAFDVSAIPVVTK